MCYLNEYQQNCIDGTMDNMRVPGRVSWCFSLAERNIEAVLEVQGEFNSSVMLVCLQSATLFSSAYRCF